jgi:hypothetical protein
MRNRIRIQLFILIRIRIRNSVENVAEKKQILRYRTNKTLRFWDCLLYLFISLVRCNNVLYVRSAEDEEGESME